MLYVKVELGDGGYHFVPLKDDNVYVLCERCNNMVSIDEPAGYFYEIGAYGGSLDNEHLCDECLRKEEQEELAKIEQNTKNSPVEP